METKVLFVYPEIPTTYWSFKYALPFIKRKSSMPPLGLLTVASLMPEKYKLKLIDMNVQTLTEEDIRSADIVFISAMIVQKDAFNAVVKLCNKCGTPVAAGGPYPSSSYSEIEGVDYFILNEAEITLPEFLKDYENGNLKKIYTSDEKPDITKIPPPRFDLVDNVHDYVFLALQYSRGCPFNCEFCDIIEMLGRTQRTKDPDQFIREMEVVYNTGFRGSLFIVDDNFIGNKKKVKELLKSIIEWQNKHNFPFVMFTEASINLAHDDELIDLMIEAGFNTVFIGIETPDTNTLALTQKKQNLREDIFENIKKIQTRGLEVFGGFIVGFDTDPDDIFDKQIDFIQKAGIPIAMIGLLTALPNTQLYRRLQAEGRLTGISTGNNTHDFQINFTPKMPKKKLLDGYKQIISEIYNPRNYFQRCLTLLTRLPNKRKMNRSVHWRELRAFLLSLLKLGLSSYGILYLKYFIKIFFIRRNLFPLAIDYAIKGYHCFRITEEIIKAEEFSTMLDKYLKGLHDEAAKIITAGNALISSRMEEHGFKLKRITGKRYRQMSNDMQLYLNDRLKKFDSYCDSFIFQWKEKLHLMNKEKDN